MRIISVINPTKLKLIGLLIILCFTLFIYSNHFENPFFFDDSHTIVSNSAITTLDNWEAFFTDASTFSSLPANRAYRPMMTLMNAIDYHLAGGLNQRYYHIHIFFWYLVTITLFFVLCNYLFNNAIKENSNKNSIALASLFATLFFATHTINAETINYICARSDSFSSLCVLASLLLFVNSITRKYHLYLLTMILGLWSKQTAVMFVPILFCFLIIFDSNFQLLKAKENFKKWLNSIFKVMLLPTVIALTLFIFNQLYLTPSTTVSSNTQVGKLDYIFTQFYVVMHYIGNFILPTSLSADPDIEVINVWYDKRILLGLLVCIALIYVAIKTVKNPLTKPISFGIAWFFIALIPTWIVPLYQIANDHRMFFPFIGLFISVSWGLYIFIYQKSFKSKILLVVFSFLIIGGYSYGTYHRNKVWKDATSLWKDVTIKSPNNGRGQMNYGLTLMAKGDYDQAENYFKISESKSPFWYAVKVNLGILNGAIGKHEIAENYFKTAINLKSSAPDPEYYYARYLFERRQYEKAAKYVQKALSKSPNHINSKSLKNKLDKITSPINNQIEILKNELKNKPEDINILIELSNKLYYAQKYEESINYCLKVLAIDSLNKLAFNNMCSCYNQQNEWKKAKISCENALKIDPDFQIAKNNLNWTLGELKSQ